MFLCNRILYNRKVVFIILNVYSNNFFYFICGIVLFLYVFRGILSKLGFIVSRLFLDLRRNY